MSTFMGLEIGRRAIVTHQVALEVTGHNIANANTVGYSRQAADIVTTIPWHSPVINGSTGAGQLGTGCEVTDIQRYRDSFIDTQIRNESKAAGYWQSVQENLSQIEGILNEPSEEGLRGVMDNFWKSWQDLSANPESKSARSVVAERGSAMVEAFNHTYQQLTDLRDDVNTTIKVKTKEINTIAEQVATLNKQIMAILAVGKQPNDLMDKRDLLIDQLSGLADIKVNNESAIMQTNSGSAQVYNGMVTIQLGGRSLVQGGSVCKLAVEADLQGMNLVVWADTRTKAAIKGGELMGLLDVRGKTSSSQEKDPSEYKEIIPTMIANLNSLAQTIIEKTNEIQRSGYSLNNKSAFADGTNFFSEDVPINFDGNWASFIQIDDAINADVNNIAAASKRTWSDSGAEVNFGDGSNALKIAQLKQKLNRPEYSVETAVGLSDLLDFPSDAISGYITIDYRDQQGAVQKASVYVAPPAKTYKDLQELASAIQSAIQKQYTENTKLNAGNIAIKVRCDGNKLEFYSASANFMGIRDGDGSATADFLFGKTKEVDFSSEYSAETPELISLSFPSSDIAGAISIFYQNEECVAQVPVSIALAKPVTAYTNLRELAAAIEEQLANNTQLKANGITVKIRCNDTLNKLEFYSPSSNFKGVSNVNLLGVAKFTSGVSNTSNPLVLNGTADDYWRGICSKIGVQSQEAERMVTNQDKLIGELENKRQSLSGVSLDEEMTNMIKYQHAYNAASRFITTIDEQLSTIINGMGLVGR